MAPASQGEIRFPQEIEISLKFALVIHIIATVGHVLPAFADERTFSRSVGMAPRCQCRKSQILCPNALSYALALNR
jgi:hypothetical protein